MEKPDFGAHQNADEPTGEPDPHHPLAVALTTEWREEIEEFHHPARNKVEPGAVWVSDVTPIKPETDIIAE